MKKITMFTMKSCPYCKQALRWMDELYAKDPKYLTLDIDIIDELEHPEISDKYNYYYVPSYYIGDEILHEGAATPEKIKKVFDAAME